MYALFSFNVFPFAELFVFDVRAVSEFVEALHELVGCVLLAEPVVGS